MDGQLRTEPKPSEKGFQYKCNALFRADAVAVRRADFLALGGADSVPDERGRNRETDERAHELDDIATTTTSKQRYR